MAAKGDPNAKRGPGAARFERLLRLREPEKLEEGKSLLYEHALRCYCRMCGSLLNWDCPQDISYTQSECCGLLYRLRPWTVKVDIEDVSSRPLLPKMEGSNYSDPSFRFQEDQVFGEQESREVVAKPLSGAQKGLSGQTDNKKRKSKVRTKIVPPKKTKKPRLKKQKKKKKKKKKS